MTDELRTHWALHLLDEESVRHDADRARLPAERQAHERKVAAARRALTSLDTRLDEAQKRRRSLDRDLATLDAQVRHFEHQLESVTDQRQFEAVQHEIAGAKAKRDTLETEALELLEREESGTAERPLLAAELAKVEQTAAEALAALEATDARLMARLGELDRQRTEVAAALPAAALSRYAKLRAGRAGRAVAALLGNACSACQSAQPPHALQEARKRAALLVCEGCGRLLLLPPEDASA